jgi:cbb3-type cytochrome c oxidase subunit II
MDKFKGVILVAGFGCFIFSVLLSGLYPFLITDAKTKEAPISELASIVLPDFKAMKDSWPVGFEKSFDGTEDLYTDMELILLENSPEMQRLALPERTLKIETFRAKSDAAWPGVFAQALELGRNRYIADACWHCHSQFVRPAANEAQRYGPVNTTEQDNNALQRPVLWGTRRVGPDLTYEGGKKSNDWHAAHLHNPQSTSPGSVMPAFPFYSREGYRVYRKIDAKKASFGRLDPGRGIAVSRHIYDSRDDAEEARTEAVDQALKAKSLSADNAGDADAIAELEDSYWVDDAIGPNAKGMALIAYLQWLGTWRPEDTRGESDE